MSQNGAQANGSESEPIDLEQIDAEIDALARPLKATMAHLDSLEEELKGRLALCRQRKQRVRKTLENLKPEPPKPKRNPTSKNLAPHSPRLEPIYELLKNHGELTGPDVDRIMDLPSGQGKRYLDTLRVQERARKAGEKRSEKGGRSLIVFKPMEPLEV